MTLKEVALPLFSEPDYSYQVSLEGSSYKLRFTYNSLMELYTMAIYDVDGNPLVSGVGLVPNYTICADYVIEGLSGTFLMTPKSITNNEPYKTYPDKVYQYYDLSYIYDDSTG